MLDYLPNRMSREGNMRCFAIFPEDGNFLNPLHPTHRRSCASREDFHLNYEDGHVACTTPIVAEIFATPIFNENAKEFQDIITNKVRVLLKYHEGNEDTMFFCINECCEQNVRRCL